MKESQLNFVELKGFNETVGIECLLDFIYTGRLELNFDNILFILDAANHLQVNEAILVCSSFLVNSIKLSNCVSILKLADTYSLTSVVRKAHNFLINNLFELYKSGEDQFYQLSFNQLRSIVSNENYLETIHNELDLFLMIVKWIDGGLLYFDSDESATVGNETRESLSSFLSYSLSSSSLNTTTLSSVSSSNENQNKRLKYASDLMKHV